MDSAFVCFFRDFLEFDTLSDRLASVRIYVQRVDLIADADQQWKPGLTDNMPNVS
jgi:hypothetical protein